VGAAAAKIDRFAYLPFGVGARICIGSAFALQEATLILAGIIKHFTLELKPGHSVWPLHRVTLKPKGGLPMVLRNRDWSEARPGCGKDAAPVAPATR